MELYKLLETFNGFLWCPVMLVLLVGTGIYLNIALRFFSFRNWVRAYKCLWQGRSHQSEHGEISPWNALMTALAADIGTGNVVGVALANAVGAGRMRQATRELIKAYACGVESAALDDVFELLAWNQGIGYFSSEIGPSTLFQAYKLIKQQEKQGAERPRICQMLREKFGEKNAEVTVL